MVAKSPRMQHRRLAVAPPPLSPTLLRDTVKKVEKCMARLQELQHTVEGAKITIQQDSFRIKNVNPPRSPVEWKHMSLPAMLLGETMADIMQATQFARNVVEAPTKPDLKRRKQKQTTEQQLHARRKREKLLQTSPSHESHTAKSRIHRGCEYKGNYIANRVSSRNRPWATKTVLFPNPLFNSASPRGHQLSVSPTTTLVKKPNVANMRRSFLPSRVVNRLVSPLKCVEKKNTEAVNVMCGLRQRPISVAVQSSPRTRTR